jgi:hypothetical protein
MHRPQSNGSRARADEGVSTRISTKKADAVAQNSLGPVRGGRQRQSVASQATPGVGSVGATSEPTAKANVPECGADRNARILGRYVFRVELAPGESWKRRREERRARRG